jgi:hypothetical protein
MHVHTRVKEWSNRHGGAKGDHVDQEELPYVGVGRRYWRKRILKVGECIVDEFGTHAGQGIVEVGVHLAWC